MTANGGGVRLANGQLLLESEAKALLRGWGIPVPAGVVASTPDEAASLAARLRFPVVAKLLSPDIAHKTELGAVRLPLASPTKVRTAAEEISRSVRERSPHARVHGFLIEELAPPGVEVLVGIIPDDVFGPILGVGIGGVYSEAYDDLVFRAVPITAQDADEMLEEVRAARLLQTFRGTTPDRAGLVQMLVALAGDDGLILRHREEIAELELNPVAVGDAGVTVLDAKIRRRS